MDKLKPCPFCGSEPNVQKAEYNAPYVEYFVRCSNMKKCSVLPFTYSFDNIEDAIDAWNRRAE